MYFVLVGSDKTVIVCIEDLFLVTVRARDKK